MNNNLITYETAKLAKEKGFDQNTYDFWILEDDISSTEDQEFCEHIRKHHSRLFNWNSRIDTYSQPTMSSLQDWLREKHGIVAYVKMVTRITVHEGTKFQYDGSIKIIPNNDVIQTDYFPRRTLYNKWNNCLEAVLLEALKLVK